MKRLLAPTTIAALLAGAIATAGALQLAGGHSSASTAPAPRTASSSGARAEVSSTALSPTQIYQRASTGVVSIKAVTSAGTDEGTGIVLNESGLILTNDHVIEGASSITIDASGSSKTTTTATLVGEEANSDLALIRVNPSGLGLKPLTLASSSSLHVGDSVYAIGTPYGLEETFTRGIVSALNRQLDAGQNKATSGLIQTDASINPGNSGGPLLNAYGQVVGINSQIASDAASIAGSQPGSTGVGFAISTNTVAQAVKAIESGKGVSGSAESASAGHSEGANGRGQLESEGSSGPGQSEGAQESPFSSGSPYGTRGTPAEAEAGGREAESRSEAGSGSSGVEGGGGSGTPESFGVGR